MLEYILTKLYFNVKQRLYAKNYKHKDNLSYIEYTMGPHTEIGG